MTRRHASPAGQNGGRAWPGILLTAAVIALAAVIVFLIITGKTPAPYRTPVKVDLTLPRPALPDTPHLPEGPVLPPVDPRVGTGPGAGQGGR